MTRIKLSTSATTAATVLLLLLACSTSIASIVYEQVPGSGSDTIAFSSTLNSFGQSPGIRVADDFLLSADTTITGVHWWGRSDFGGDAFTFTFYKDAAGLPGDILLSTTGLSRSVGTTASPHGDVTVYESVLTTPFDAEADTKYWLSIFNSAADATWAWLSAHEPGNGSARRGETLSDTWISTRHNSSFRLTDDPTGGAVPELSSWATWILLGLTVSAAAWRRKNGGRESMPSNSLT